MNDNLSEHIPLNELNCDKTHLQGFLVRFDFGCLPTKASQRLEIWDIETSLIMLLRQQTIEVLIRLCR